MEKSTKTKSKASSFIKKNLYLILMIVCAIAIVTIVAVTYALKARANEGLGVVDAGTTEIPTVIDEAEPIKEMPSSAEVVFSLPLEGEVVGVFSNDTLVYNATLNQWSTHEAYDVACEVGTEVKCIYDGTVTSISTSVLRGTEVVVSHGNGMRSVYSLLDSDVKVTVNQKIKKGDSIGKIGETGTFEKHKGAHLHLKLFDDAGTAINPEEYFESTAK